MSKKKAGFRKISEEQFKKWVDSVKTANIPFFCKVGQVEAGIFVFIEPDPFQDNKGTYAHFHIGVRCPKFKFADFPEPGRCQVTAETCPFVEPFGGYVREPEKRKWLYAQRFLHNASIIEFYSELLLGVSLRLKGFNIVEKLPDLRYLDIIKFLLALSLVDKVTYNELDKVRKERNKLAHDPAAYARFHEAKLLKLVSEMEKLMGFLHSKISLSEKK